MFACSRRILPSPAEAGFKPPHYRLERNEDNRGLRPRRVMYFWPQKVQIAVFDWSCLPLFGRLLTAVFARGG